MKKILLLACVSMSLASCGYSAKDIEAVGQVKRVVHNTPLLCPNYVDIDLSFGVMRNGVGSMSTQDIWIVVDKQQATSLKDINEKGDLVKITYDNERLAFCTSGRIASSVERISKE